MEAGSAENPGFRRKVLAIKAVLSLFLVFHLFCVVLTPNKSSYLGQVTAPWVEPYMDFLTLSVTWGFFAPEPGPPPVFVEWELVNEKGEGYAKSRWPEFPDPYFLRERQNRRMQLIRSIVSSDERIEQVMLPFLCQKYPDAHAVRLWRAVYGVPSLTEVASGARKIADESQVDRKAISHSFCTRTTVTASRSEILGGSKGTN